MKQTEKPKVFHKRLQITKIDKVIKNECEIFICLIFFPIKTYEFQIWILRLIVRQKEHKHKHKNRFKIAL